MMTCGDLGGQACPLLDKGACPLSTVVETRDGKSFRMCRSNDGAACHPMRMAVWLAKEAEERDRGVKRDVMRSVRAWLAWAAEVGDE